MRGIGRKRRSSRPSHDASEYWASSQVILGILLFCPLWVACRENNIAIEFVTSAGDSLRGGS